MVTSQILNSQENATRCIRHLRGITKILIKVHPKNHMKIEEMVTIKKVIITKVQEQVIVTNLIIIIGLITMIVSPEVTINRRIPEGIIPLRKMKSEVGPIQILRIKIQRLDTKILDQVIKVTTKIKKGETPQKKVGRKPKMRKDLSNRQT